MKKDFMSGSELRQYLHISTRKMKYLMDHDYIPHENTGHATHKYRVRREEAEKFKYRMETEDGFLAELAGKFSNRTGHQLRRILEPTAENSKAFRLWLEKEWAELPEALPTKQASEMSGINPQCFNEMVRKHKMYGIIIRGKQYCRKTELIAYMSAPIQLVKTKNRTYYRLIDKFVKTMKK